MVGDSIGIYRTALRWWCAVDISGTTSYIVGNGYSSRWRTSQRCTRLRLNWNLIAPLSRLLNGTDDSLSSIVSSSAFSFGLSVTGTLLAGHWTGFAPSFTWMCTFPVGFLVRHRIRLRIHPTCLLSWRDEVVWNSCNSLLSVSSFLLHGDPEEE